MKRLALGMLVMLSALTSVAAADRPPNIVFLFTDDLGWGDVGYNGRTEWATPNIDNLARQGIRFDRFYSAATVCAPSRAALMTGRYGIHNGVVANFQDLPAGEVTIAEALRPLGYTTALFGKWHHGAPRPGQKTYIHPLDRGFDEFVGFTNAGHAWEQFPKQLWFGREMKPVEGHSNTLFTDRAVAWMKENKDRPFFLYLPFNTPHFHIQAPPEDVAEFKGKFPEKDPNDPINAAYAASISRLDKLVGRIMAALDELNLADNTLVVFTNDNGATFESGNKGASAFHDSNRPLRGQKRTLWEGGIRVPGVVRWPARIKAEAVSNDPVHMIDMFPTLLAAAGGKPAAERPLDGVNLLDVWTGQAKMPERTLFWEWRAEGADLRAAMRGDFKLVISGTAKPELYDLSKDPSERRDVSAEHPAMTKRLIKEVNDWMATESPAAREKPPVKKAAS